MAALHKQMHKKAAKQKCKRQKWHQMLAMINDNKNSDKHQEADQDVPGA